MADPPKPFLPQYPNQRERDAEIEKNLQRRRSDRWLSLAAYMKALPYETRSPWELLECLWRDITALYNREKSGPKQR